MEFSVKKNAQCSRLPSASGKYNSALLAASINGPQCYKHFRKKTPACLGVLGIPESYHGCINCLQQLKSSHLAFDNTATWTVNTDTSVNINEASQRKRGARSRRQEDEIKREQDLWEKLSTSLMCSIEVSSEKGPSTWLTTLPLVEHGYLLNEDDFFKCTPLAVWLASERPTKKLCLRKAVDRFAVLEDFQFASQGRVRHHI